MIDQLGLLRSGSLAPARSRGGERLRRAGLTGATSMLSQGLVIATGFISVPLTVNYLGQGQYGVWLTLNSLLNWLAISDLGLSRALFNGLAEASGREDQALAQELVSTAFWGLIGIAAVLTLIFAVGFSLVPWPVVFNAQSTVSSSELHWAVTLSFAGFVLMFPASIVDIVYQSHQRGYIGQLWGMAGSVLSLAALIGVTRVRGGLPLLVCALSGTRILVTLVNLVYLFGRQYPWLLPVPGAATRRSFRQLTSLGSKYLVAQLAGIGMFQSQPIIIAQVLGPTQLGIFNIAQRLLTLPLVVVQIFVTPLASAYSEAYVRQDWPWIHGTLKRSLIISAIVTACMGAGLTFLTERIVSIWVGPAMVPSRSLVLALSLYVLIAGIVTPASVMLYGLRRVGAQASLAAINALVTVVLGTWLTHLWGLPGMAVAMAVALAAVNPLAQVLQIRSVSRVQKDKRG